MAPLLTLIVAALFWLPLDDQYLVWNDRMPLAWDHFRGPADTESPWAAFTRTRMDVHWGCAEGVFDFFAVAMFDTEGSWRRAEGSDALLAHEQLHFDIAEVYVRTLRKRMAGIEDPCRLSNDEIRAEVRTIREAWHIAEVTYDEESDHGLDVEAQALWTGRVRQQLQALRAWARP